MTERLRVRCRTCREVFDARLQVDRATFAALMVHERYRCPRCGTWAWYEAADHRFELCVDDPST